MKKAVSYARYSSELQRDSSIEDQQALCRRFAEREGYTITNEYSDRAQSGASLFGRDGFHKLMTDANAKAFDVVIVESLDRISRDQADTATIFKHLTFAGVSILTCHDGKVDAVQVGIRGLVGSMYLTDLGHKVRRGQSARVAAGKNPGGRVYGYRPVRGEPGEIEIDKAEAAVVTRIFAEYADGSSTLKIARGLNDDGVPSARGRLWWANTLITSDDVLGGLLRCEQYVGIRVWNRRKGIKNPHTGKTEYRPNPETEWQTAQVPQFRIVSDQLWERVRARLGEKQKRLRGRPLETGKSRLLTGLLYCGVCGGRMMRAAGHERGPIITCRIRHHAGPCTHNRYYKLERVEAVVIKMVREMLKNPVAASMFIEDYVEACRKENAQLGKRRKQAQTNLNRARAAKDRVVSLGVRGIIDLDATEQQARPLMVEIAECEVVLARTPDAPKVNYHPVAAAAYRLIVERLAELLNDDHMENTRLQLRKLIEKVIIHPTLPFKPYEIEIQGLLVAINDNAPPCLLVDYACPKFRAPDRCIAITPLTALSGQ